jgi:DNA-directed RNA polymerase subunit N (RpoN/RPB10)
MRRPLDRGAAINARRYQRWLAIFSGYRNPVTQRLIELWLNCFAGRDQDLAARILDSVHFIGYQQIQHCFRQILAGFESIGWHSNQRRRRGRWFFVAFSGSVGESGDRMIHEFRMANSMTRKQFDYLFIHRSELVANKIGPNDTVVLIDDFSGTGKQVSDSWQVFHELLAGGPRIILVLVAATSAAIQRIRDETGMEVRCCTRLQNSDNIFADECEHFTEAEKDTLLGYCGAANKNIPKGFGDCGLVLVLVHRCPNNTIPILHANHDDWIGLFPRDD